MTRATVIALAIVAALALAGGLAAKIYSAGAQGARQEALTKGVELVKERDKLNVEVRTAKPADICRRLGGQWMPDTNECG